MLHKVEPEELPNEVVLLDDHEDELPAMISHLLEMSNEEYQALIRLPGEELRPRLISCDRGDNMEIATVIQDIPNDRLSSVLSNLGGHDLEELLTVLSQAETKPEQPTIIFAYTIKGWGLPIAGHPLNHSMLLNEEQIAILRQAASVPADDDWAGFNPASPAGRLCGKAAARLFPGRETAPITLSASEVPEVLSIPTKGVLSTQQSFGRLLMRLARIPKLSDRIVTTSPDVSVSTNLSGWIIKTGVFALQELPDYETEANQPRKMVCKFSVLEAFTRRRKRNCPRNCAIGAGAGPNTSTSSSLGAALARSAATVSANLSVREDMINEARRAKGGIRAALRPASSAAKNPSRSPLTSARITGCSVM